MRIPHPLQFPADTATPAAPVASPAPDTSQNFARVVDSDATTADSLKSGFMEKMEGTPRRRGRDNPPTNEPMKAGVKEEPTEPVKYADPMDEKPASEPKPEPQSEPKLPDKQPEAKGDKEQNLRKLATERDTLRQENETFKKRLAEAEARIAETADYPKIKDTLAQREKRLEESEQRLRQTNYTASDEYKEKWLRPMEAGYNRAIAALREFQVEIPGKPDEFNNPGSPTYRDASEQDFVHLYKLPEGAAWKEARKMFGDSAPAIMQHRQSLKIIDEGAQAAAQEYQTKGHLIDQERTAKQVAQQQEIESIWESENKRIADTMPKILQDRADDKDHNEALNASRQLVDSAYSGSRNSMDPKARVQLDARIRSRAVAYGPMMVEITRLRTQLKQAEERAGKLESGDPGVPGSTRTTMDSEPKSLQDHFFSKTK